MLKIKKDDEVVLLAGKNKGQTGKVLRIVCINKGKRKGQVKVFVEGANMVKKHVRPNPQAQKPGGILEVEASIQVSNVALLNPATKKADRVGFKFLEDGSKVRYFKSNDEVID